MDPPAVSVVLPTRGRAPYLEVVLDTLERQDAPVPYELLVVDDGSTDGTRSLLQRRKVPSLRFDPPRGLNAARNAGVANTSGDLIAFIDDDVALPRVWLRGIVEGAERHPEADAFGGPIRARFEGRTPQGLRPPRPAADHARPRSRRPAHRPRLGREHGDPALGL